MERTTDVVRTEIVAEREQLASAVDDLRSSPAWSGIIRYR